MLYEVITIIAALAGLQIQQITGDVGEHQLVGFFIDELVEAALATPIAQRLPLSLIQLGQGFGFPERVSHHEAP